MANFRQKITQTSQKKIQGGGGEQRKIIVREKNNLKKNSKRNMRKKNKIQAVNRDKNKGVPGVPRGLPGPGTEKEAGNRKMPHLGAAGQRKI